MCFYIWLFQVWLYFVCGCVCGLDFVVWFWVGREEGGGGGAVEGRSLSILFVIVVIFFVF